MSRPLRLELPGAVYHVTSRGDRREAIYRDDADRVVHIEVLAQAMERFDAQVLAYCLMGNHFHVVLHTRRANLSRLMRHLNGVYTQRFNRRHELVGHLFQGRFKAILVDRDAYLLWLCRYVERNPVAAGLVSSAADWVWSSCRAHLGLAATPVWLDSAGLYGYLLGRPAASAADRRRAASIYVEMVDEDAGADLWSQGLHRQVFLGDDAFVERMLAHVPASALRADGVPRAQTRSVVRSGRSDLDSNADRGHALRAAYAEGTRTMTELAGQLGLSVSRVSRLIAKAEMEAKGKT